MEAGMVAAVVVLTLDDGRTEEVALEQSDTVGRGLFMDRNDIVAATIPEGVTTIGRYAFWGCSSLTSVTIPEGVTAIGNGAFVDCSSLASVAIPQGVTTIGGSAFKGCTSLASVTIPVGVTRIATYAFFNCRSLTRVTIMNPTAHIESNSFLACYSINAVNIHDDVKVIFTLVRHRLLVVEKKIREMHEGRPAWQHVFPTCPAANIKWRTSVREKYEAGFVDRTTAMEMLLSMRRTREDPRFSGSFPAEMMQNVLEYAV